MNSTIVQKLVADIERKDLSTAAHTWRVVLYTRAMCEEAGIADHRLLALTHAAALHDVGKLDIPSHILQKPDRLTDEEFEIIQIHPVAGYARMIDLGVQDEPILDLIRYHHERWDGMGYPCNLSAENIPLCARYFAVIDSFDAMTSHRPYRHIVGEKAADAALLELEAGRGVRYYPDAVEMFSVLYRSGRLNYILHYFNDDAALHGYTHDSVESAERDARAR